MAAKKARKPKKAQVPYSKRHPRQKAETLRKAIVSEFSENSGITESQAFNELLTKVAESPVGNYNSHLQTLREFVRKRIPPPRTEYRRYYPY